MHFISTNSIIIFHTLHISVPAISPIFLIPFSLNFTIILLFSFWVLPRFILSFIVHFPAKHFILKILNLFFSFLLFLCNKLNSLFQLLVLCFQKAVFLLHLLYFCWSSLKHPFCKATLYPEKYPLRNTSSAVFIPVSKLNSVSKLCRGSCHFSGSFSRKSNNF